MGKTSQGPDESLGVPAWVPATAVTYLAHTERGEGIRALARQAAVHPSTILRQVRRWEMRRDDPLIDAALRRLSRILQAPETKSADRLDPEDLLHILRRLAEPGVVLAIARDMETAILVRDLGAGQSDRIDTLDRRMAEDMALRDWIASADPAARVARYRITPTGRGALREGLARSENSATGLAETQAAFEPRSRSRSPVTESPLAVLGRRRDRDGRPFLGPARVRAGERLREDDALADLPLLDRAELLPFLDAPEPGERAAARLWRALRALGPDMAELMLRCCCHQEGLETTERALGWSARSGKVVLRIALTLLTRHYETEGEAGQMIG